MSAERPQRGDVWLVDGEEREIIGPRAADQMYPKGGYRFNDGRWYTAGCFTDGTLTFVRSAAPAKVEWARWLPPHPLPDTGPKEFKAGQVWAFMKENGSDGVVRIMEPIDDSMNAYLASREFPGCVGNTGSFAPDGSFSRHAVLIQDVGEAHPRPVEQVYGKAEPAKVPWKVGQRRRGKILGPIRYGEALVEFEVVKPHGRPACWTIRALSDGATWSFLESWPSELLQDVDQGAADAAEAGASPAAVSTPVGAPPPPKSIPCCCRQPERVGDHSPSECVLDDGAVHTDVTREIYGDGVQLLPKPAPLGMSEAAVSMLVHAAHREGYTAVRREAPKGTSEAELAELANPWKRRRS